MFLAVHRHGSFTRAARELDVAQSTMSNAVLEFERALGHKLFTREPRGVRLTAVGEAILEFAARLAATEEELLDAARTFDARRASRLTLATNESVSSYLIPDVTARLLRDLPHVTLDVRLGLCPAIREQVLTGHVDVAVLVEPARPEDTREGARILGETPLVLCVHPRHPLVGRRVRLDDLWGRVVTMTYTAGTYARLLGGAFLAAGLPEAPTRALGSIEAVKRHVLRDEDALALLPAFVVKDEVRAGTLVALTLERPLPSVQLKLLRAPGSAASAGQEVLLGTLRRALSELPSQEVQG